MDNRTIEEVRENETKLIDEIKQLEKENKKYKGVFEKAIWYLDLFISSKQLSKYDTLKILMHIKNILKEVEHGKHENN